MMADTVIYSLACTARSKLCREALSGEVDLRRVVGHANVLDYVTAELVKFGYGWDTDDTVLEENEPVTPPTHVAGGVADASGRSESSEMESSEMESAESSDQSDSRSDSDSDSDLDSDSDSESDSAESWKGEGEGEGDYEGSYGEYVDLSTAAQISRVYSCKVAAIQVSVLEVDEFDD
jgi:hypothetical protein